MSSFSSVVRKGPKVAPRVAPRRNIVRRPPAPTSTSTPENPVHVEPETVLDPPPPSSPAIREDADSQPSTNVQETVTPPVQKGTPGEDDRTSDALTEPTRPAINSGETPDQIQTHEEAPAATTVSQASAITESQVTSQAPATAVQDQETHSAIDESNDPPRSVIEEVVEENNQLQEPPEIVTDRNDGTQAACSSNGNASANTQSRAAPTRSQQRRKRKQQPHASPHVILAQSSVPVPSTSPPVQDRQPSRSPEVRRAASRAPSVTSQRSNTQLPTPENEFDRISSQLQTVQEASAAINARTLSAQRTQRGSRATSATTPGATEDESTDQANTARPRKRRRTNRNQGQTAEEQAAEIVRNVVGDTEGTSESAQKRLRGATPEDAEDYEITPEVTKMGDLCEDSKRGKKSETEKEMAANWDEILRRRKEDAIDRIALAAAGSRRKRDKTLPENTSTDAAVVPGLDIRDGQIVVMDRVIDRHAALGEIIEGTDNSIIREDKDIYKRVLATTVGCRNPLAPGQTWDDLSTEQFYTGLKQFGTDFQMISATISSGKTRKQVKLKYNVEERKNWARVKRCLGMKEEVTLEGYAEATGVQFASVADVYKQMEDDEKRLREEDEQRRRDEGIISQDQDGEAAADGNGDGDGEADVAVPSIETGAEAAAREIVEATIGVDRQSTASRVGSTTTARQTAQPTGKKKQTAKKNTASTSKKGRQAASKNKGFEGVEERIGGIEDVARPGD